mmetsp:Transcript_61157/g.199929  ORF Transcript_61157/g.199929 Transcript_61157/m.199929 type:complete len:140 (+) Transcript_61157:82-501(+)
MPFCSIVGARCAVYMEAVIGWIGARVLVAKRRRRFKLLVPTSALSARMSAYISELLVWSYTAFVAWIALGCFGFFLVGYKLVDRRLSGLLEVVATSWICLQQRQPHADLPRSHGRILARVFSYGLTGLLTRHGRSCKHL